MRRARIEESESSQDSFLDVVANVVGVLIILIMLIGARASQGLLEVEQKAISTKEDIQVASFNLLESSAELERMTRRAIRSEEIVHETAAQTYNVIHAMAKQEQVRLELAGHRSIIEEDIQRRRNLLDAKSQREFDTKRKWLKAQLKLENLTKQQLALLSDPGDVQKIEVIPTPVALQVEEDTIHIRIQRGKVCYVPLNELRDEMIAELEYVRRATGNNEHTELFFGPQSGFRLRMRRVMLERSRPGPDTGPKAGVVSSQAETFPLCHLLPELEDLGENVDLVLQAESIFLRRMQGLRKQSDVITVWLYEDSFDQFRPLKKVLYEMGYRFDVRMKTKDALIGFSPYGRPAIAQ